MFSSYTSLPALANRMRLWLAPFLQGPGLPFADVLTEQQVDEAFSKEGVSFGKSEDSVYTPAVTLWAFLSQVLHSKEQGSCRQAVSRVIALMAGLGRTPPSPNTGAYCRARAKLPEAVLSRLTLDTGRQLEARAPTEWLWFGRHVKLVDGTTITTADTLENQQAYPQHPSQKPGLGFPLIRMVVVLSLATAALCALAFGPYLGEDTGETALLRPLLESFQPGDILLADRFYCSYLHLALLRKRGADWVTRLHQARKPDFRRGVCMGIRDLVVQWKRPARPEWMDEGTYVTIPEQMRVREIRVRVEEPGFRPDEIIVVTSLLNERAYPTQAIAELYHYRWNVELDIRAIKQFMDMNVLRCKTPAMVEREIWVRWLAYNLIRKSIAQASLAHACVPRQLSYVGAKQAIVASWDHLTLASVEFLLELAHVQLHSISRRKLDLRPGRVEPRAKKSRDNKYVWLSRPRDQARKELLRGRRWALR